MKRSTSGHSSRRHPSRLSRRSRLEQLEARLAMDARIWDGGGLLNDNWTNPNNWEGNVAPVAGDSLFFPGGIRALDRTTLNDFPEGTRFARLNTINLRIQIVSNNNFFGIDADETVQINGAISGSGALTKNGPGRLILAGNSANTYDGPTQVREGVLQLQKAAGTAAVPTALQISTDFSNPDPAQVNAINNEQIANAVPVTVERLGTLSLAGTETIGALTLKGGVINGAGTLALAGNVTVNNPAGDSSLIS